MKGRIERTETMSSKMSTLNPMLMRVWPEGVARSRPVPADSVKTLQTERVREEMTRDPDRTDTPTPVMGGVAVGVAEGGVPIPTDKTSAVRETRTIRTEDMEEGGVAATVVMEMRAIRKEGMEGGVAAAVVMVTRTMEEEVAAPVVKETKITEREATVGGVAGRKTMEGMAGGVVAAEGGERMVMAMGGVALEGGAEEEAMVCSECPLECDRLLTGLYCR